MCVCVCVYDVVCSAWSFDSSRLAAKEHHAGPLCDSVHRSRQIHLVQFVKTSPAVTLLTSHGNGSFDKEFVNGKQESHYSGSAPIFSQSVSKILKIVRACCHKTVRACSVPAFCLGLSVLSCPPAPLSRSPFALLVSLSRLLSLPHSLARFPSLLPSLSPLLPPFSSPSPSLCPSPPLYPSPFPPCFLLSFFL